MIDEMLFECEEKMEKVVEAFKREMLHIRTGRATPNLLDGIKVEYSIVGMFSDRLDGLSDAVSDGGIVYRLMEYDTPFLDIMGRKFIERQGINILDIEGFRRVIGKLIDDISKVPDHSQLVTVTNLIKGGVFNGIL